VKQLIEDFATYLYLPRLRDPDVLVAAIREGVSRLTWETDTFAYAQGKDEDSGRYLGLEAAKHINLQVEGGALLVRPEVAARQMREDAARRDASAVSVGETTSYGQGEAGMLPLDTGIQETGQSGISDKTISRPVYRRFYGSVKLDSLRVGRDAGRIADEVIQHLTKLVGAEVEVTLEIQARLPDGVSDKTVRDVTENCRTLRFDSFGFEDE